MVPNLPPPICDGNYTLASLDPNTFPRHDTSPRDFVHILSLDCIYSSPVFYPSNSPTVPTPVISYAGDAIPHTHTVLYHPTSDILLDCIPFSLILLSDTIVIHACTTDYLHTLVTIFCTTNIPKHIRYSCLQHQHTNAQTFLLLAQPIFPRTTIFLVGQPIYPHALVIPIYQPF